MRISAYCQLHILGNVDLNHGRLIVNNFLDGDDNLVDVFFVERLAVLEALNHVVDKLLCHLASQTGAIVGVVHMYRFNVEALGGRGFISNLDGSIKGLLANNLLGLDQLELRILVAGVDLDASLEIPEGFLVVQDSRIGCGATVVGLMVHEGLRSVRPLGLRKKARCIVRVRAP